MVEKKYENVILNACLTAYKNQDGEPLFLGSEVAACLGYKNTRHAITRHVDDQDKCQLQVYQTCRPVSGRQGQGRPNAIFITESGFYDLAFRSKLPQAKAFRRWVTNEVLPSVRKSGFYVLPEVLLAIKGIEPEDVRKLRGEGKKEFRKESKVRSNLAKDQDCVERGRMGGSVASVNRRAMVAENEDQKTQIETLEKENKSLKIRNWDLQLDVRDIIQWVKDLNEGEKLTRD